MAEDGYGKFSLGYAYPQPAGYQFRGKAGPVKFGNPLHQGTDVFTGFRFRGQGGIFDRAGNRGGGKGSGGYRNWIGGGGRVRGKGLSRPGTRKSHAVSQGVVQGRKGLPLIFNPR
jgi:hypothetical protein